MNKVQVGTIQGRLVPKYKNNYQAHPIDNWKKEFKIAKQLKLNLIEFILDYNDYKINPLLTNAGIQDIKSQQQLYSINVISVCADFFMILPIHSKSIQKRNKSLKILKKLITNCYNLGIKYIVIPCVDNSCFHNNKEIEIFKDQIKKLLPLLKKTDVYLSIESDLPPKKFKSLIEYFQSNNIKINYDIGNSAYMGYDYEEEINQYGKYISHIHIKDRNYKGASVLLGKGEADIKNMLIKLKKIKYKGPFILQAYRDNSLNTFKRQHKYFYNLLKKTNWI